jgi:CRISPR-associated protein Csh2
MIKERREVLFLYDVSWANPNGDPLDENKPRIDEETLINYVTDVRLKRTIRDYIHDFKKQEIFIREERVEGDEGEKGNELKTKDELYKSYGSPSKVLEKCIDIRLFGGTFALKKGKKEKEEGEEKKEDKNQFALTGPVQFKYGHSLHKVKLEFVRGTTVMPSGEKKEQGTFTERYILPYSLIAFYGVVNENAAENQNILVTDEDLELMLEGMWEGTKNLLSTSKVGQMPRFLLEVTYKEKNYHLGELDKRIKLVSDKLDEEIRDISEVSIDATELVNALLENLDKTSGIKYKIDERVKMLYNGKELNLKEVFKGINVEEIHF